MASIYTDKQTKAFKRISKAINEARNNDGYINCNKIAKDLGYNHTAVLKVFSHIMPEFNDRGVPDDKVEEIYKVDEFKTNPSEPQIGSLSHKTLLLFEEDSKAPTTKYGVAL